MVINGRRVVTGEEARKFATPGSVHVDELMTDFALNFKNLPFITGRLFPTVPVTKESDKFAIFNADRKAERIPDTKRGPRSRANVVEWSHTYGTYAAEENALAAGVDDRERANADEPIKPDQRATAAATIGIELGREARIAALVTTAGPYAASHKVTLIAGAGATQQWSFDASQPLNQKEAADEAIETDAGVSVNTIAMSKLVFNRLRRHPVLIEAFKYTKGGILSREMIASYFDIEADNLLIPGAFKNTAALGAAAAMSRIWGDFVWMGFVDPSATGPLDGVTFGKTFQVSQQGQSRLVREFRDDPQRTDWKEVSEITDEKVTAYSCGYLISDVLA
jgi:hypothetical protein